MTSLKAPNGKSIIIGDASNSMLDEFVVPCSLSTALLGDFLTFTYEPGQTQQPRTRIRDVLYEYLAAIDANDAGSSYSVFLPYSFWESFEVFFNDVLIYECASPNVDQAKKHVQRVFRRCKDALDYKNTILGDLQTNTSTTYSSTISNANNNVQQSVNLSEFFHGILQGLWTHRLKKFQLRIQLKSFNTATEMAQRIPHTAAGTDVGRETRLPQFKNTRLRFRLERFKDDRPDPIPTSMPLILYHPRYEQVVYSKPFASVTTKTINIKNEFSPNKMINYLNFYLKNNSANVPAILHEGLSYFSEIKVSHNGIEKEKYTGVSDFYRYLNKNLHNEYGHGLYLSGQADDTYMAPRIVEPFIHFKGVHDRINSNQVDNVVVIAGKNNEYNNDEITITVSQTLANHDLYVTVESFDASQVFANGKVERMTKK